MGRLSMGLIRMQLERRDMRQDYQPHKVEILQDDKRNTNGMTWRSSLHASSHITYLKNLQVNGPDLEQQQIHTFLLTLTNMKIKPIPSSQNLEVIQRRLENMEDQG